jgi:hypothetical protein
MPAVPTVDETATSVLGGIKEKAGPVVETVAETAASVIGGIKEKAGPLVETVAETASSVADGIKEKAGPVVETVTETTSSVVSGVKEVVPPVVAAAGATVASVVGGAATIIGGVLEEDDTLDVETSPVTEEYPQRDFDTSKIISTPWPPPVKETTATAETPVEVALGASGEPVVKFDPVVETVTETASSVVGGIKEKARPVVETVTETASSVVGGIKEKAGPVVETVTETASSVVGGIKEKAGPVVETVAETALSVIDRIEESASPVVEVVSEIALYDEDEGFLEIQDFILLEKEAVLLKKKARPVAQQEVVTAVREGIVKRVRQRIAAQGDKFQLTYSEADLQTIFKKARELGLEDALIEDMTYTGSRVAKAISAADLMQQMENWARVVSPQKFPYKFNNLAEFQQFSRDLLAAVEAAGLPTNDVRVQGSSLRKPTADDVDLAVFVDEATFDKLLVDYFEGSARFSDKAPTPKAKLPLRGKSHAELLKLADDIMVNNRSLYNSVARTFANAMKTGIINSMSDIIKPLKTAQGTIASKYPHLNIKTISVLIRKGAFDVKPDMPIKGQ